MSTAPAILSVGSSNGSPITLCIAKAIAAEGRPARAKSPAANDMAPLHPQELKPSTARTVSGVECVALSIRLSPARYEAPGSVSMAPTTNVTRAEPFPSARCHRGGPFSFFLSSGTDLSLILPTGRSEPTTTAPPSTMHPSAIVAAGLNLFFVDATRRTSQL
jgi:hypothetical protein